MTNHWHVAVHSIIDLTTKEGHYPDDTPMTGEVRLWAMERVPREWIVCAGQLLPISRNTMLFALLRNVFGGDGRTTFAVPDLQGAFPMHPGKPEERGQASASARRTEARDRCSSSSTALLCRDSSRRDLRDPHPAIKAASSFDRAPQWGEIGICASVSVKIAKMRVRLANLLDAVSS